MPHLDPDRLALLALGEPAGADESAHLSSCDRCALELAELEYTVAVGRSTVTLGELETPPERVWDRIAAELQLEHPDPASGDPEPIAVSRPARNRWFGRRPATLAAIAASLALLIAAGGYWGLTRSPEPTALAAATLEALPAHPASQGTATVVEKDGGRRVISITLDAPEQGPGRREVWLLRGDVSALVSLGILEGTRGEFTLPANLDLDEYPLVDISLEPDDGDPGHSGDSIVRGELAGA